KKRRHF
ncbi:hypothetical protein BV202_01188B, partial [Haemophilus influenzae]